MKKIFFKVSASNMTGAAFGFLFQIALARLLSIDSYGRAAFIFSLILVLSSIADFGFSNSVVIFQNKYPNTTPSPLMVANSLFYRFQLFFAVISIPVMIILSQIYDLAWFETGMMYISTLSLTLYRYFSAVHQGTGNWHHFSRLQILANALKCILGAGCVFVLSYWGSIMTPYHAALLGYMTASLVALAVASYITSNKLMHRCEIESLPQWDFIRTLVPLGITAIFVVITMRFDYLVIQKFLGEEMLGIYSVANTLAFVFPLVTISLLNIMLGETAAKGDEMLSKIMSLQARYLPHLLIVFAMVWLLADYIIPITFGRNYIEAIPYFQLLLIPYIGGIFFTPLESYFYAHEPKTILWFKGAQMLIVVTLSLLLVGSLKLYGVTLAIVISRILGWGFIYNRSKMIVTKRQVSI